MQSGRRWPTTPGLSRRESGPGRCGHRPPNCGKSSLIAALTAPARGRRYPYTTHSLPLHDEVRDVLIQLVDTPAAVDDVDSASSRSSSRRQGTPRRRPRRPGLDLGPREAAGQPEGEAARVIGSDEPLPPGATQFVKRTIVVAKNSTFQAQKTISFLKEYFAGRLVSWPFRRPAGRHRGAAAEALRVSRDHQTYSKIPGKKPALNDPFALKKGTTVRRWRGPSTRTSSRNSGTPGSGGGHAPGTDGQP